MGCKTINNQYKYYFIVRRTLSKKYSIMFNMCERFMFLYLFKNNFFLTATVLCAVTAWPFVIHTYTLNLYEIVIEEDFSR